MKGNGAGTGRGTGRKAVRRALISVYDKTGVVEFARRLTAAGVELISSGGTARMLEEAQLPVTRVSDVTGFPEMLGGRVKTLHPRIHAGILAVRDDPSHREDLERHGIAPIDLVAVNLYPFERAASSGAPLPEAVEMIDIGGPTLVRAAAKNHADVAVVVEPARYGEIAEEIERHGGLDAATRARLAVAAFRHTAAYDEAIAAYLARAYEESGEAERFPGQLRFDLVKVQDLRYGENPHQSAAFYRESGDVAGTLAAARQLHGTKLSFNNILDLDAAVAVAYSLERCGCAVIKHGNPCGAASAETPREAFLAAREGDPVSAFGGIVAFNRRVDADAARELTSMFLEVVAAPEIEEEALEILRKKKKLRVIELGPGAGRRTGFDVRRVSGGLLLQEWDGDDPLESAEVVTRRPPTDDEWRALRFAWRVCRHVRSNAIVFALADRTVGIGAGQMSRVDSVKLAAMKAGDRSAGAVMASDAFFPFRDGVDEAAKAGIRAVIQPGGSIRDKEVIAAADEHGLAMVFTGRRHFRH